MKRDMPLFSKRHDVVVGNHNKGKFYVAVERWEKDGKWYKVCWEEAKSHAIDRSETIVAFRVREEAETFAAILNDRLKEAIA